MVTDAAEDVQQAIAELEAEAKKKAEGAATGDVLYETELPGGAPFRRRKQRSMVTSGGVELPEWLPYYRSRDGSQTKLPTVQLGHYLAKRHPDGTAVFVKEKPDLPEMVPYKETCVICLRNSNNQVRKCFKDEFAYVSHMEVLHPREYRVIQARAEKAEGQKLTPETLALSLMTMTEEQRQAIRALLGGANVEAPTTTPEEPAKCEACGWEGKPTGNPDASLRTHRNLHCPKRAVAASGDAD